MRARVCACFLMRRASRRLDASGSWTPYGALSPRPAGRCEVGPSPTNHTVTNVRRVDPAAVAAPCVNTARNIHYRAQGLW
ncbi:hypothetical protein NDU88_012545 [Pleurodeles waltl]|uniref:Secreted protein n=1 Tax=Pleurodeles waltl TaxID=8319 RepID=A0AAV7R3J9_PLEWA|nr:hypothetical protein NDU88_012545 [Pleurodeles waltl]